MNRTAPAELDRLETVLGGFEPLAVAVSGGVDSSTLAQVSHLVLGGDSLMFHAVSPAVPSEATGRVRAMAAEHGWALRLIDAGEFADPDYLANPVDRCFHCKSRLYGAILRVTDRPVVSGANTDDLDDIRPGMKAAADHGVRHPYIEAGIGKAGVRAIAAHLGLGEVAGLPASPCLSSRIETGLAIDAANLAFVDAVESMIGGWLEERGVEARTLRCRVRRDRVAVELDAAGLALFDGASAGPMRRRIDRMAEEGKHPTPVKFEPYRRGGAFLRRQAT